MDLGIAEKTALVMSSSRGFGAGISDALAAEGANVLLTGRSEPNLSVVAERIDAAAANRTGKTVDEVRAASRATIPAGRYGPVAEFASTAAFLCSVPAGYISGSLARCDGELIGSV